MSINAKIDWKKEGGKIPTIIQDVNTLQVLMLGYMTEESLNQTVNTGLVTFYSRSKKRLWVKGEASGHFLHVVNIDFDCDGDAFLIQVHPEGPTCHQGTVSCFSESFKKNGGYSATTVCQNNFFFLTHLEKIIAERKALLPENSYVTSLFSSGIARMAQKVGEEGVEVALAAVQKDQEDFLNEAADLVFHLLVLLQAFDLSFSNVIDVLQQRME